VKMAVFRLKLKASIVGEDAAYQDLDDGESDDEGPTGNEMAFDDGLPSSMMMPEGLSA
jgi:hypothetical protein